jgi:recombinational DNA repair protein RecR
VKPAIAHQSSVKDVKKCIKCKAFSEDETCAACHMSSHLKNVTVTRIETPSKIIWC